MSSYWKHYWDKHVESVTDNDPFRRVLRVQNKQPLSESLFSELVTYIIRHLKLGPDDRVLDLCCGNGLITTRLARYCKQVVAVDFCQDLIEELNQQSVKNVSTIVTDVAQLGYASNSVDRILLAAALQHFSQPQVIYMFCQYFQWLKSNGILLLTDILDSNRIWQFYDDVEREAAYFENTMNKMPILGTWFDGEWLIKLARYAGFSEARIIDQPEQFLYSHYRFDFICYKA